MLSVKRLLYAFFSQYCSWAKSHRSRHCDCPFYIYTLLVYTNTRSVRTEWRLCSKTPKPEIDIQQNLHAYETWILLSSISWATVWRMQLLSANARVFQRVWKKFRFYCMSLNAMKCDCGNICLHYLHKACFLKTIRFLDSYLELKNNSQNW